jgi:hypothetical protein
MQDALFALDLIDSELRDRPRLHPDEPGAEPELPEERASCPAQPGPGQQVAPPVAS